MSRSDKTELFVMNTKPKNPPHVLSLIFARDFKAALEKSDTMAIHCLISLVVFVQLDLAMWGLVITAA